MKRLFSFYFQKTKRHFWGGLIIILLFNFLSLTRSIVRRTVPPGVAFPLSIVLIVFLSWKILRMDSNKYQLTLASATDELNVKLYGAKVLLAFLYAVIILSTSVFFRVGIGLLQQTVFDVVWWQVLLTPVQIFLLIIGFGAYFVIPYSFFETQMQKRIGKIALLIPVVVTIFISGLTRRGIYEIFGMMPSSSLHNPSVAGFVFAFIHCLICGGITWGYLQWSKKQDIV